MGKRVHSTSATPTKKPKLTTLTDDQVLAASRLTHHGTYLKVYTPLPSTSSPASLRTRQVRLFWTRRCTSLHGHVKLNPDLGRGGVPHPITIDGEPFVLVSHVVASLPYSDWPKPLPMAYPFIDRAEERLYVKVETEAAPTEAEVVAMVTAPEVLEVLGQYPELSLDYLSGFDVKVFTTEGFQLPSTILHTRGPWTEAPPYLPPHRILRIQLKLSLECVTNIFPCCDVCHRRGAPNTRFVMNRHIFPECVTVNVVCVECFPRVGAAHEVVDATGCCYVDDLEALQEEELPKTPMSEGEFFRCFVETACA